MSLCHGRPCVFVRIPIQCIAGQSGWVHIPIWIRMISKSFVHIATKNTLCIGIGIGMEESAGEIENRSPLPLFGYYVHTYYRIPLMWLSIHPWLNNGFDDYSHLFYRTIGPKLFWILNWICKLFFTGHFLIFLRLKFETISFETTKYLVQFCYQ